MNQVLAQNIGVVGDQVMMQNKNSKMAQSYGSGTGPYYSA